MTNTNAGAGAVNTREIVLDMLMEICEKGTFSHIVLRQTLRKYQYLDKRDRAFMSRITEGTVQNKILLDFYINKVSKIKVNKMKPLIRNLLRMSVYQILFMDSVPASAACNEAVKLAIKRSFGQLKGFVNGVLRAVVRGKDDIKIPNASENLVEHLHVAYSMPTWLVEQLVYQYGTEEASRIIKSFAKTDKAISVRVNSLKITIDEVIESLKKDDVTVKQSQIYDRALLLENVDYLENTEAFNEGFISVQDLSSMLVSVIADPREGDFCVDLCAAPGGKSLHMWELMRGKGRIIARDINDYKVSLIEENIDRTESDGIEAQVADATELDTELVDKVDIVIADLPCSGLGVIGKKSDIKYNMDTDKESELIKLQRSILDNAVKYVKKGGKLIYSTCTLNKNENIDNMKYVLDKYQFKPVDISEYVPENFCRGTAKDGYLQMLPGIDGTDGFFICRLEKL